MATLHDAWLSEYEKNTVSGIGDTKIGGDVLFFWITSALIKCLNDRI